MSKSVLVADDSATMRRVIEMVLKADDVVVTLVTNGTDALAKAQQTHPDVVVADYAMPGKSGFELCEALKADPATAGIPVLVLGGTFEPFDEARATAVGASATMLKPFDSTPFIDKVRALAGLPALAPMTVSYAMATSAPMAAKPAAVAGQPAPMPGTGGVPSSAVRAPMGPAAAMPRPPVPGAPMSGTLPPAARPPMPLGTMPPPTGSMRPPIPPPGAAATLPRPNFPAGAMPGMPARPGMPQPGMMPPGARPPMPGMPMQRPPMPAGMGPGMPPAQFARPPMPPGARPPDGGEGALREALTKASREVIERIVWEVVPQLAEVIIREHVEKLAKQRQG